MATLWRATGLLKGFLLDSPSILYSRAPFSFVIGSSSIPSRGYVLSRQSIKGVGFTSTYDNSSRSIFFRVTFTLRKDYLNIVII